MTAPRKVRVVVIGAGTAGLSAHHAARTHTDDVVLVEGGPLGTMCARVGCIPSKLLVAAGDAAHRARIAGSFGVPTTTRVDGAAVMRRVREERDRFVGTVIGEMERMPAASLIRGRAEFVGPRIIRVGDHTVEANAIVVATGSHPTRPSTFAAIADRAQTSDDVFAWTDLPGSAVVFGAGPIGLELGQALARLGVRTRVLGTEGKVGALTDPAVIAAARDALGRDLDVDFDADIRDVSPRGDGVAVTVGERTETFAVAILATGRARSLDGLALDRAGLDPETPIDRRTMRWGESAIFVAGDATDEHQIQHEAHDQGTIAGRNAACFPDIEPGERRSPMAIAFCDPQLALVGSTHRELTEAKAAFAIGAVSFADQGRSRIMRENRGELRVYADRASRRFLGAEMIAPRAEHLAHLLAWAHQQALTIDRMLEMPFYHPVFEEGLRTALRDARRNLES